MGNSIVNKNIIEENHKIIIMTMMAMLQLLPVTLL